MASALDTAVVQQAFKMLQEFGHRLDPRTSVEFWTLALPVIAYWVVSLVYEVLDRSNSSYVLKHRVTRRTPGRPNPVGRGHVAVRVLLQQALQTALGLAVLLLDPEQCKVEKESSWALIAWRSFLGMVVMDAWQYWIHRIMHLNTFLYKHIHSTHHRLLITYAYGALYNHPLEALLLDSLGGVVTLYATGMSCHLAGWFFAFSSVKTVLDHCGYLFPLNPLHDLFPNSAAFHDVHHDIRGIKKNFSQPFFTYWDTAMGTYLDPRVFHVPADELPALVDAQVASNTALTAVELAARGGYPEEAKVASAKPSPRKAAAAAKSPKVAAVAAASPRKASPQRRAAPLASPPKASASPAQPAPPKAEAEEASVPAATPARRRNRASGASAAGAAAEAPVATPMTERRMTRASARAAAAAEELKDQ